MTRFRFFMLATFLFVLPFNSVFAQEREPADAVEVKAAATDSPEASFDARVQARLAESLSPTREPRLKRGSFYLALWYYVESKNVEALRGILAQEEESERIPGSLKMASDALYDARAEIAAASSQEDAAAFADEVLETGKTNAFVRGQTPKLFAILGRVYPDLGEDYLDRYAELRRADENASEAEKEDVDRSVKVAKYQLNLLNALDGKDRETREQIFKLIGEDAKKDERFAKKALSICLALRPQYYEYMTDLCAAVGLPTIDEFTLDLRDRVRELERRMNAARLSQETLESYVEYAEQVRDMVAEIDELLDDGAIFIVDASSRRWEVLAPFFHLCWEFKNFSNQTARDADPELFARYAKTLVGLLKTEEFFFGSQMEPLSGALEGVYSFNPELAESLFDEAEELVAPYAPTTPSLERLLASSRFRGFANRYRQYRESDFLSREGFADPESAFQARAKDVETFLDRAEKNPFLAIETANLSRWLLTDGYPELSARAAQIWLDAYKNDPKADQARFKTLDEVLALRKLCATPCETDDDFKRIAAELAQIPEGRTSEFYQGQIAILYAFGTTTLKAPDENRSRETVDEVLRTVNRALGELCIRLSHSDLKNISNDKFMFPSSLYFNKGIYYLFCAREYERIQDVFKEEEQRDPRDSYSSYNVAKKYAEKASEKLKELEARRNGDAPPPVEIMFLSDPDDPNVPNL